MNSLIQSLSNIESFASDIELLKDLSLESKKNSMPLNHFLEIVTKLRFSTQRNVIEPKQFRENFVSHYQQFKGDFQHDAHEFLISLFSYIDCEVKLWKKALPAFEFVPLPSASNFEFAVETLLKCPFCKYQRSQTEETFVLSLDLQNIPQEIEKDLMASKGPDFCSEHNAPCTLKSVTKGTMKGSLYSACPVLYCKNNSFIVRKASEPNSSVSDLLSMYMGEHTQELHCGSCEQNQVLMQHSFKSLPSILIFHLKRFYVDSVSGTYGKRQDEIDICSELNLKKFCSFNESEKEYFKILSCP
jgi:uncharacterized UBP type Zn finger protein